MIKIAFSSPPDLPPPQIMLLTQRAIVQQGGQDAHMDTYNDHPTP